MKKFYLLVLSTFCIHLLNAQIVAWQFGNPESVGNEATYAATTLAANLEPSILARGAGINPGDPAPTRSFASEDYQANNTRELAIAQDEFMGFTIEAQDGYQVSLSTLDARLRQSGVSAPTTYLWRYSLDGVNFTDIGTEVTLAAATGDGAIQPQIDLSGVAELQNVASGTVITLRLYAWGSTASGSTLAFGRYGAGEATNSLAIGGTVTPVDILPVRFSPLKATQKDRSIELTWSNATEENIANYIIERSANGRSFDGIAELTPRENRGGNATYSFLDAIPNAGDNFYRIKATETSGKSVYTNIVRISTNQKGTGLLVYPNPVKSNSLNVQFSNLPPGQYTLKIIGMNGQQLDVRALNHSGGSISETLLLKNLRPGLYSLQVSGAITLNKVFLAE